MKMIALIDGASVVSRILKHLGICRNALMACLDVVSNPCFNPATVTKQQEQGKNGYGLCL